MNFQFISQLVTISMLMFLASSCGTTDLEPPSVCTDSTSGLSVLADEIEWVAGETLVLADQFCDDQALSEVRWDVHNAADHAHEAGENEAGLVLHSGKEWEVLEIQQLTGTNVRAELTLAVPLSVRGVWDVVVSVVDAEGNLGEDVVTQLHIDNLYLPEFILFTVNGTSTAEWTEEPSWSLGTDVALTGLLVDSDGLASAALALVHEDTGTVVWSTELEPAGQVELALDVQVEIPADAFPGEYHLEFTATDALGNAVDTGFHVVLE